MLHIEGELIASMKISEDGMWWPNMEAIVFMFSLFLSILIGGMLPFGAVFIELFFILTSIWLNQFYYIFGFLFIVFVILLITCAEITMVLCYFQLCSEDYNWWWRSYLTAPSIFYQVGDHKESSTLDTKLKPHKGILSSENGKNSGCEGGWMDNAFDFIIRNHGLTTEADYPYTVVDGTCNAQTGASRTASITVHEDVPANSESALQAVANQPISVAIGGGGFVMQTYSGGVFTGTCGTRLDHGVTVVGYGVTDDGTKYWLVKNSWGAQWGEEGYMRMQRVVDAPGLWYCYCSLLSHCVIHQWNL